MKKIILLLICSLGFILINAQTPEEMKAWENSMTPGAEHKLLETYVGEWMVETKVWMDPSQPPVISKGNCVNSMTLGGRYLEYVLKSDFMGMPFEGKGTMAFDKTEKKFKSTWRDNMSTGITYMEGTYDKNNSTLTTIGTSMDPMTMQEIQTKEATKFVSKDKYVMEMYMTMDGKEIKTMEVTYTRK